MIMDKGSLKRLVNDKYLYDDFLAELRERVERSQRVLERSTSIEEVYRAQGEIKALRALMQLREKVNDE